MGQYICPKCNGKASDPTGIIYCINCQSYFNCDKDNKLTETELPEGFYDEWY